MIHIRAKKREETTQAILDEAERLIEGAEPAALTLLALTEALGVTPAAIYRYYPSKEAIIVALQRRTVAQLGEDVIAALNRIAGESPLVKICAFVRTYATLPERRPTAFRLIALSLADPMTMLDDKTAGPVGADTAALLVALNGLFADCAKYGYLAPPRGVPAAVLWGQIHGLLVVRKLGRLPGLEVLHEEALVDEAVRTLLLGMGGDKAQINRAIARVKKVFP
ncbi:MAG: TetR/AcrR family transcriptional regulator [Deltaproteobacteria bacterium]|nr:TetR/AcrR family transcriptional regulator [Deltaproteobacteria bacterium]